MSLKLGVGTGCFYRLKMTQVEIIKYLKKLEKVDAVEITLSDQKELETTSWSKIASLVQDFRYVSIHAPIKQDYNNKENSINLLKEIEKRRKQIGAETVVFHPDRVEKPEILTENLRNAAIENMQLKKKFDRDNFSKFHENGLGFVLDIVHANTWKNKYPKEAEYMFQEYQENLKQFHISAEGNEEEHEPLYKYPDQLEKYSELLTSTNKPLILESKLETKEEIKEELEFISSNLR